MVVFMKKVVESFGMFASRVYHELEEWE